jgi:hypothetical protein
VLRLKPEVTFSPAFTPNFKQKSSKVVVAFKSVVLVSDMVHCKFEA